jgi:polar amino acid transport system substrate-binding protein
MTVGSSTPPNIWDYIVQPEIGNIVALVVLAIVVSAHIVWYFERHENSDQFPSNYLDGIDDAIWWSSSTVTTVGYGDKSPLTTGGRIFGLLWQFTGVVFLGLFAGTISASINSVRDAQRNLFMLFF